MSLVSSKSKKVFLYKNRKINVDNKVDVILSPEFYWVRIFDIPVKNNTQARHVLPTLFEDVINDFDELSFQVIKLEEGKYLCYAYSNKKIFEEIKKSGIPTSLVNAVYFAQNECVNYKSFKIDDIGFIYTNDNILVKVPKGVDNKGIDLDKEIEKIDLSSNKVDIKFYSNVLSTKYIYYILSILLVVIILNIVKIFSYKSDISKINEEIQLVRKNSSLPTSSLQTTNILSMYKNKVDKEIKKREILEYILQNKEFDLNNIELEKDILSLSFENVDKKKVESYINKKYKILSTNVSNIFLNVRIKL